MTDDNEIICQHCGKVAMLPPVILGDDGIPLEASCRRTIGLPFQRLFDCEFFLDGKRMHHVVAHSIPKGLLWTAAGQVEGGGISRGPGLTQHSGKVEVRRAAV